VRSSPVMYGAASFVSVRLSRVATTTADFRALAIPCPVLASGIPLALRDELLAASPSVPVSSVRSTTGGVGLVDLMALLETDDGARAAA
jgi:hypothetical protein